MRGTVVVDGNDSEAIVSDAKEVSQNSVKITRDAFIYFAPKTKGEEKMFAQCGACRMFIPGERFDDNVGRCILHGTAVTVDDDDSCAFMAPWPTPDGSPNPEVVGDHAAELKKDIPGSVTPIESGLVSRLVQCHRCKFSKRNASVCGLYEKMNNSMPSVFNLKIEIEPHGCCNAQEPR